MASSSGIDPGLSRDFRPGRPGRREAPGRPGGRRRAPWGSRPRPSEIAGSWSERGDAPGRLGNASGPSTVIGPKPWDARRPTPVSKAVGQRSRGVHGRSPNGSVSGSDDPERRPRRPEAPPRRPGTIRRLEREAVRTGGRIARSAAAPISIAGGSGLPVLIFPVSLEDGLGRSASTGRRGPSPTVISTTNRAGVGGDRLRIRVRIELRSGSRRTTAAVFGTRHRRIAAAQLHGVVGLGPEEVFPVHRGHFRRGAPRTRRSPRSWRWSERSIVAAGQPSGRHRLRRSRRLAGVSPIRTSVSGASVSARPLIMPCSP